MYVANNISLIYVLRLVTTFHIFNYEMFNNFQGIIPKYAILQGY